MSETLVSAEIIEPYAAALMATARSNNLAERFEEDVRTILGWLNDSAELRQFLANPLVTPELKKAVLRELAGRELHSYMVNFLMLLVDRRRIVFLEGICKQFQELFRQLNQTVLAEITSVVELTSDQRQAISQKVVDITGARRTELDTKIDPELIGGIIIKVGSRVIDASLRGQLRRIALRLGSATA